MFVPITVTSLIEDEKALTGIAKNGIMKMFSKFSFLLKA